jgi:hypothetical protein
MDASEFFEAVVKRNWQEFNAKPDDFGLLWNAIVSMNTVAEYLVLHRLGYAEVPRPELERRAEEIRNNHTDLSHLKFCVDTLKHGRKTAKPKQDSQLSTVATSTGVLPDDQATWRIGSHHLVDVARRAFDTLNGWPELLDPEARNDPWTSG